MCCRAQWSRLFLAAALFCSALAAPAFAQEPGQPSKPDTLARIPELDDLAARVATELHKAPRRDGKLKVAVFVLQHPDGSTSRFDVFLSNAFAAALARQISDIEFLDQELIRKTGKSVDLSDKEIADEDVAHFLAQKAGAAVLITGTFETIGETAKVSIRATDGKGYKELSADDTTFPLSKEWLGLGSVPAVSVPTNVSRTVTALADSTPLAKPGKDGIGEPHCAKCPDPSFTQAARNAKYEGTVLLRITISAEGFAQNVRVVKPLDYGLSEQAILAVKSWKFKPAKGPDGKPVPVEVMIEVTFRLLK